MRIENSYKIKTRKEMIDELEKLRLLNPSWPVWNRSMSSLVQEWCGHNLLYNLHLFRDHTRDSDFEYPQSKWVRVIWFILNLFYRG